MVRRHIPTELKELALSMSLQGLHASEIQEYTGISTRSIKRFRSLHRRTGNVVAPPPIDIGRPRVLNAIHITVRLQYLDLGCCLIQTDCHSTSAILSNASPIFR
jgi:transposase